MVEIFAGIFFREADVREMVLIFEGFYFRAKWKNGNQNAKTLKTTK